MAKKTKKEKKGQKIEKGKAEGFRIEVSQTVDDVKAFVEKFKSDVGKKREEYKSYAQRLRKKES